MKRQLIVESVSPRGQEGQSKDQEKKQIFQLFENAATIGTQIKEDLLNDKTLIRKANGGRSNNNLFAFSMDKGASTSGILDRSYGVFLLTNLYSGFGAYFTSDEKKRLENSIEELLEYVQEYSYDASPYAMSENRAIFGEHNTNFIESLSWCFSCFLYAHKLEKKEGSEFDFSAVNKDLDKAVADALQLLLDNVICADGSLGWKKDYKNYVGWGAVTGTRQASLYFTNSVCETYGDLEDTILGNKELGIEADNAYINRIADVAGYDIVHRFEEVCKLVGRFTYKKYGNLLGDEFFYEDGSEATKGQIEFSTQSPVLLNQLYAVMIPIYTNYHVTLEKDDPDAFNLFQIRVKDGVDMVYKEYSELMSKGKEDIVNRDSVSFLGVLENKRSASILTKERINIAVLEALIIRARAMIVTYVTKYPEKELGEIVGIIEKKRPDDEKWIWGNLQETERYVSALKEFYDYYTEYEQDYAKMTADRESLNKSHQDELDTQKRHLTENFEAKRKYMEDVHGQEIAEYQKQIEEMRREMETSSPIEREINGIVESRIDQILLDRLQKIADYNNGNNPELTAAEKAIKQAIDQYVCSYFADALRLTKDRDEVPEGYEDISNEQILRNFKESMDVLVSYMLPFACTWDSRGDFMQVAKLLQKAEGVRNTPDRISDSEVKK